MTNNNARISTLVRHLQAITSKNKRVNMLAIIYCCLFFSGCQLTTPVNNNSSISDYYLWISSLTSDELRQELNQQQLNAKAGFNQASIHLILLHALAQSPVYNPYTAKTMLNNLASDPASEQLSSQDFALLSLLREQLNQHILTTNKLLLAKQQLRENDAAYQANLANKQAAIDKLQQQITQLKRIELTIENEQ